MVWVITSNYFLASADRRRGKKGGQAPLSSVPSPLASAASSEVIERHLSTTFVKLYKSEYKGK